MLSKIMLETCGFWSRSEVASWWMSGGCVLRISYQQARMQLRTRTDAYLEAQSGYASALAAYLLMK